MSHRMPARRRLQALLRMLLLLVSLAVVVDKALAQDQVPSSSTADLDRRVHELEETIKQIKANQGSWADPAGSLPVPDANGPEPEAVPQRATAGPGSPVSGRLADSNQPSEGTGRGINLERRRLG